VHADFSIGTSQANRETQSFVDLDEISAISFLIEIFRGSSALSARFYTPNLAHVDFSIVTSHAIRKTQSFVPCNSKNAIYRRF
jgi:hypothetical protein